jgi:hypothetical protein
MSNKPIANKINLIESIDPERDRKEIMEKND